MSMHERLISRVIVRAVLRAKGRRPADSFIARIIAFFSFFQIPLVRIDDDLFGHLRDDVWKMDEEEYQESFRKSGKKQHLKPVGDLGYSGSTFFVTPDSKYLIKSLPRQFEHSFFADDMLLPYCRHIEAHPDSLLIRITDFLCSSTVSVGSILGFSPSHHIVMENMLYGKDEDEHADQWETYDLKPTSYFYPERDIADGNLAPESVKDRLIDEFNDKLRLTSRQFAELRELLEEDTKLLESLNAVDYSLFLVRLPNTGASRPTVKARESSWRTGVPSLDGKWIYRIALLDFFWAKHKLPAKAMTGLVRSFNFFARNDDMSITTTPDEYRQRFLRMINGMTEVEGIGVGQGAGAGAGAGEDDGSAE